MNIGMNNSNYSCNPTFGMSVFLDKSADKVIKKQAVKMSQKTYDKFWAAFNDTVTRQEGCKPDIIVRKANHRDALVAEVVEENTDTALKNYVTAQGLIHKNGSLKFLNRAEKRADKLRDIDKQLENTCARRPESRSENFESFMIDEEYPSTSEAIKLAEEV